MVVVEETFYISLPFLLLRVLVPQDWRAYDDWQLISGQRFRREAKQAQAPSLTTCVTSKFLILPQSPMTRTIFRKSLFSLSKWEGLVAATLVLASVFSLAAATTGHLPWQAKPNRSGAKGGLFRASSSATKLVSRRQNDNRRLQFGTDIFWA
jgi:hypothetical protein